MYCPIWTFPYVVSQEKCFTFSSLFKCLSVFKHSPVFPAQQPGSVIPCLCNLPFIHCCSMALLPPCTTVVYGHSEPWPYPGVSARQHHVVTEQFRGTLGSLFQDELSCDPPLQPNHVISRVQTPISCLSDLLHPPALAVLLFTIPWTQKWTSVHFPLMTSSRTSQPTSRAVI